MSLRPHRTQRSKCSEVGLGGWDVSPPGRGGLDLSPSEGLGCWGEDWVSRSLNSCPLPHSHHSSQEPSPYDESEVHDSFHQLIQEQSRWVAEEGLELQHRALGAGALGASGEPACPGPGRVLGCVGRTRSLSTSQEAPPSSLEQLVGRGYLRPVVSVEPLDESFLLGRQ